MYLHARCHMSSPLEVALEGNNILVINCFECKAPQNLLNRLGEEIVVPLVNQVFLDEILKTEENNLLATLAAGFARRKVAEDDLCSCWVLTAMVNFITVNEKFWLDVHIKN